VQLLQPLGDTGEVMLEPVRYQQRLSTCGFDDVLQRVQLLVMKVHNTAIVGVDSAICHLAELAGESGGVGGSDFSVRKL